MSRELRNGLLKYGFAALVGGLMAGFTITSHGYGEAAGTAERLRILSDAFTIPGVVLIMFGFLVLVANGGFFNGLSYIGSYAVKLLIPGMSKDMEKYGDYVERKRAGGKRIKTGFLFIVGGVILLAAVVFTILYYQN